MNDSLARNRVAPVATVVASLVASVVAAASAWPAAADPARPVVRPAAGPTAIAIVSDTGAAGEIRIRTGEHPGFSRIVFDLPPGAVPSLRDAAERVLDVRVPGAHLLPPGRASRGLQGLSVAGDTASLSWPAGSTVRRAMIAGRLVVDVMSPTLRPSTTLPAAPPARPASGVPAAPAVAAREPPAPAAPPASQAPALPAPREPILAAPVAKAPVAEAPVASESHPEPAPSRPPPPIATPVLPFAAGAGVAAFRRGASGLIVFDEPRTLDITELAAMPALAGARIDPLPGATLLRVPLASDMAIRVFRAAGGWTVEKVAAEPDAKAIRPAVAQGRLDLPLTHPGRVVAVPDEDTGGLLLVGTQTAAQDPDDEAERLPAGRRLPRFALLPTWRGVAVAPLADDVDLVAKDSGFAIPLAASGADTAVVEPMPQPPPEAARLSRLFDLPAAPVRALALRLQAATQDAAGQPARGRGAARLAVGEAMLALGMAPEAQAVANLATAEDPRLLAQPRAVVLTAVSALLAGRLAESNGLDAPSLSAASLSSLGLSAPGVSAPGVSVPAQPGADEIALWQALRAASLDRELSDQPPAQAASETASQTATQAPTHAETQAGRGRRETARALLPRIALLLSYPSTLRARVLPLAIEALLAGGEQDAARRVVEANADDPSLEFARVALDELDGHADAALQRLDRLAASPDRDARARAAGRAIEARLAAGSLDAKQTADALDALAYAWRGDGQELSARLRVAALREQSGAIRAALATLREAADPALSESWASQRGMLHERLAAMFARAVEADAKTALPPLEFLALIQDNADLTPAGADGQRLAERMADRLAELDLGERADPILERLVRQAPAGVARAALGLRLAALRQERGDHTGALTALSASTAEGLPRDVVAARTIAFARATAARGNVAVATDSLGGIEGAVAETLRAKLLEDAGRWQEASAALQRLVDRAVPPEGPLSESQAALLVRLATAAARGDDAATLATLAARDVARVPAGHSADVLRVLTQDPVRDVADLPRASREIALARSALR